MPDKPLPILIIGAGVAGLTLAQGLRLRSIAFRLFERRPQSHIFHGHRFRISKDGQSALNSVLSPLMQSILRDTAAERHSFEPRYVDITKLDYPAPTPVDPESMPLDRAWIRQLLSLDIEDTIEYEKNFESYYETTDGMIDVTFADGSVARGRMLIGADGIKSLLYLHLCVVA
ncbi:hypothetical protein ONZ43_g1468 [Nemania bipapillata]|uniref:Uncharacterized protein n=1 Tax=Nemania bipapillata TaxID=110536 RepID=A0ACC2J4L0_9PEZI|nr:hypothetical protein ONZ43_g1468 [Nemania bipapillata]